MFIRIDEENGGFLRTIPSPLNPKARLMKMSMTRQTVFTKRQILIKKSVRYTILKFVRRRKGQDSRRLFPWSLE